MSSHWHYQLMVYDDGTFGIHEMYHMDDGDAWTENPSTVTGESVDDLKWSLKAMLDDIEKHGVVIYGKD